MSYALPFARGAVWASTVEGGAPPSGIMGKLYVDPLNGQIIQVVKNTDASALAGCKVVKWETLSGSRYEVDKVVASGSPAVAGVVDPTYANKGVTVPVNAAFFVVKRGLVAILAGATITVNSALVTDSAVSNNLEGRIQGGAATTPPLQAFGHTRASANAGSSCLCHVNIA